MNDGYFVMYPTGSAPVAAGHVGDGQPAGGLSLRRFRHVLRRWPFEIKKWKDKVLEMDKLPPTSYPTLCGQQI